MPASAANMVSASSSGGFVSVEITPPYFCGYESKRVSNGGLTLRIDSSRNATAQEDSKPAGDLNDGARSDLLQELETPLNAEALFDVLAKYPKAVVLSCVVGIQVAHRSLDSKIIHSISRFVETYGELQELQLRDCLRSVEDFNELFEKVEPINCKITKLSVTATTSAKQYFPTICKLAKSCKTEMLNIAENDLTNGDLEDLKHTLLQNGVESLRGLDIGGCKGLNMSTIADIIVSHRISELRMTNCDLSSKDLLELAQLAGNSSLMKLDLSYNPDLGESSDYGGEILRLLASKAELKLRGCNLKGKQIEALLKANDGKTPEISSLDLSYNPSSVHEDWTEADMEAVGRIVKHLKVQHLTLSGCEIDEDLLESFSKMLGDHEMKSFRMADNASIEGGMEQLAELVKKCSIQDLDLSNCMLEYEDLRDLFVKNLADISYIVSTSVTGEGMLLTRIIAKLRANWRSRSSRHWFSTTRISAMNAKRFSTTTRGTSFTGKSRNASFNSTTVTWSLLSLTPVLLNNFDAFHCLLLHWTGYFHSTSQYSGTAGLTTAGITKRLLSRSLHGWLYLLPIEGGPCTSPQIMRLLSCRCFFTGP